VASKPATRLQQAEVRTPDTSRWRQRKNDALMSSGSQFACVCAGLWDKRNSWDESMMKRSIVQVYEINKTYGRKTG
jgi:hypothetical protein